MDDLKLICKLQVRGLQLILLSLLDDLGHCPNSLLEKTNSLHGKYLENNEAFDY